jgi:hypothetical protein
MQRVLDRVDAGGWPSDRVDPADRQVSAAAPRRDAVARGERDRCDRPLTELPGLT